MKDVKGVETATVAVLAQSGRVGSTEIARRMPSSLNAVEALLPVDLPARHPNVSPRAIVQGTARIRH